MVGKKNVPEGAHDTCRNVSVFFIQSGSSQTKIRNFRGEVMFQKNVARFEVSMYDSWARIFMQVS